MKLRTQFLFGAGILIAVLVAMVAVAVSTGLRVGELRQQHDIADMLQQQANDLSYVSNDYLLYREPAQRSEWEALFASFSSDLGRLAPDGPETSSLISAMKANSLRLRQVFADVASAAAPAEGSAAQDRAFLQTSWSRLEVQNRGIVSSASRLERLLEAQADRASEISSTGLFAMMGVVCLLLLGGYFFVYRRTISGIVALQAGTEVVGRGHLDYFVPEDRTDELGALAKAFNTMTLDLKSAGVRYESQRSIATKLQQSLLDIPQHTGGVEFSHLYRSATFEAAVGGDFYDVYGLKQGRVAVLIGDVSGHGVEAARIATLVKDFVRVFVHQLPNPSSVMASTNDLLIEMGVPGFVTLFLAMLDPRMGALTYCSAGHPNALVRSPDGQILLLEAASAPLGVFPGHAWSDSRGSLGPEDILFLYTDGAIDARRNGDFFTQTRLIDTIGGWGASGPKTLPQTVLDAVLEFGNGTLADDVAMVALKLMCEPAGSEA